MFVVTGTFLEVVQKVPSDAKETALFEHALLEDLAVSSRIYILCSDLSGKQPPLIGLEPADIPPGLL